MRSAPVCLVVLVACASSPAPPRTASPPSSRVVASADAHTEEAVPTAPPEPTLRWGTRGGAGPLYPIVDGICIHGTIFPIENGTVFAYGMSTGVWSRGGTTTAAFVTDAGLLAQDGQGFGKALSTNVSFLEGRYPDRMFAIFDVSSRMVSASELYVGRGVERAAWQKAIDSGARWTDAGNASLDTAPTLRMGKPLALGDGAYLVPIEAQTGGAPRYSFRLVTKDGTVAPPTAKVPGADLADLAFRGTITRLDSGEILGVRTQYDAATKLVRWSPTRKVRDLAFASPAMSPRLVAGKKRAYVEAAGTLFVYDGGDALMPAKVNARLASGFQWNVGPDDELIVVSGGMLLEERVGGEIREETAPDSGPLFGTAVGAPWILASGKGPGGSDALFRRREGGWDSVRIPPPPFGSEQRSPLKVEGIDVLAKDDAFVNVRRIEKGFGWKTPEPFRVIYRTKKPREVMRCQDVRSWQSTGVGLWPWAPAADESCKDILVVAVQEQSGKASADYPNLRARLKGKTEYGEKLTLVNFEGRGGSNLGIEMTDLAKAKALASDLSSSLDLRAEVSCGKPIPTRTFTLDVAKGTFAF
jgi:hypothetical protein